VNAAIGNGPAEVAARNANLRDLLARHVKLAEIGSVLDYGGDHGQFIPPEFRGARRVVYEVSGVEAQDGAVTLADWGAVSRERFDLVLCNHVLEHLADPDAVVGRLATVVRPGGWLYFEVPAESPFRAGSAEGWKQGAYRAVLRSPVLGRLYLGLKGETPHVMHEHVNLFDEGSIAALLGRRSLRLVEIGERELDCAGTAMRVISALARPG
jgi:SAM-dependent methyltransferase